ncbi:lipocalin-like domain-containing protein [Pseudomonas stutzeri]|uniref:lipocalin-like domain-containing protein n=1 Tax=Stutzerimonas stutzeri TaxID=316 RepID=UPI001F516457|nr:lipocalin-like domain-containing protein [Stutzerimonas stutzeri]MCI0916637.1 lipocalin-like domain-containing protein [Stutzerimonas stutzeri]
MNNRTLVIALGGALALSACARNLAFAEASNQVVGTWTMVSATTERQGVRSDAYGPDPHGWLVFTEELTFVEVLTDPRVPKFASEVRGEGTDEENRAAMAGGIGFFGRYSVDQNGEFSGNTVEGSTFPNWVGAVRTRDDLQLRVEGERMIEDFRRPDGTRVHIEWERVRQ